MSTPIQQFTHAVLSRWGALVEPAGDGVLDVLAGPDLRRSTGLGEYERLVFSPEAGALGTMIDYDAPLVERLGHLLDTAGRIAFVRSPSVRMKPIDPEHELGRALVLQNGIYRFQRMVAAESVVFCFVFEYGLLADERAGGLFQVWVNPETRSSPVLASWLDPADSEDEPQPWGESEGVGLPWALAIAAARASVGQPLAEFRAGLARRQDRDLVRLRDYYLEIDREIRRKVTRPRLEAEVRERETARLEATARAYQGRVAELRERYRLHVRLRPIGVFACRLLTHRLTVRLMRRTAFADVTFSWNPIDGRIERRACDGCQMPVDSASLCDDRVHYVCDTCLAPCGTCGRPFCRACGAACPRRH